MDPSTVKMTFTDDEPDLNLEFKGDTSVNSAESLLGLPIAFTSLADNDFLRYDSAMGAWVNSPISLTDTDIGIIEGIIDDEIQTREPVIEPGTTSQYWRGDKSWQTLDKSAVGLTNVNNTSDADKPISLATQDSLDGKVDISGDVMTGDLMISGATTTEFIIANSQAGAGGYRQTFRNVAGSKLQWLWGNNSVEDTFMLIELNSGKNFFNNKARDMIFQSSSITNIMTLLNSSGNVGLLTNAPQHTFSIASGNTGISINNASDMVTNYERFRMYYNGTDATLRSENGGTGSLRRLVISQGNVSLRFDDANSASGGKFLFTGGSTGAVLTTMNEVVTLTSSTTVQNVHLISPTINQGGSGGYTAFGVSVTETGVGSGSKRLLDLQVGGASQFNVSSTGTTTVGPLVSPSGKLGIKALGTTNTDGIYLENSTNNASIRMWIDSSLVARVDNALAASGSIALNGAGAGFVGINTLTPNFSLTFGSVSTGIADHRTTDQTTNYERAYLGWASGSIYRIRTEKGGTGSSRALSLASSTRVLDISDGAATTNTFSFYSTASMSLQPLVTIGDAAAGGTFVNATGIAYMLRVIPTINGGGTGGYTAIYANVTESAAGSGAKNLIDLQMGGTSRFKVSNIGATTIADSLDIGSYGNLLIAAASPLKMAVNTNGIGGVEMMNTNPGVAADFRFMIRDSGGHYLAFAQPGSANTDVLFGYTRSTLDLIFSNGGVGRTMLMGTLTSNDLVLGTNGEPRMFIKPNGNIGFNLGGSYGSGIKVIGIGDATTIPTTNPSGGGILYSEGGALKWRGPSGNITLLGAA